MTHLEPDSIKPERKWMAHKGLIWMGGLLASLALLLWMFLGGGGGAPPVSLWPDQQQDAGDDGLADGQQAHFAAQVLRQGQQIWAPLLQHEQNLRWEQPALVLFTERTNGACGYQSTTAGSFYCPENQTLFLDLASFSALERHPLADFTRAFVVAHLMGHQVQTLTGVTQEVERAREQMEPSASRRLQALEELQATCYAGVWFNHNHPRRQGLSPEQIQRGLQRVAAQGKEIDRENQGSALVPDDLNHGSARQRAHWFNRGLTTGKINACDTFQGRLQALGSL